MDTRMDTTNFIDGDTEKKILRESMMRLKRNRALVSSVYSSDAASSLLLALFRKAEAHRR
jgi:hypothetical protein